MEAIRTVARSFYVQGYQVTATFTMVAGKPIETTFEWDPLPPQKRITHRFVVEYRKKRDAVMKVMADELDGVVVVIDQLDRRPMMTTVSPGDVETTRQHIGK